MFGILAADIVSAVTCPGFPGYCSESFVGQTCVVVCSRGRPNVPLCQVCIHFLTPRLLSSKFIHVTPTTPLAHALFEGVNRKSSMQTKQVKA